MRQDVPKHQCIKHSGLTRAYFATADWRELPKILDIMQKPTEYTDLMYHIALNHKGLNWKIYKYQLTLENYPVFIYSLAFCAMNVNPTDGFAWQIQKNAKRVLKFLNKNNLTVSHDEDYVLDICAEFLSWEETEKQRDLRMSLALEDLSTIYRYFSA